MQSSNPLIVVGISAAIAIGSATTATAKPEPLTHKPSIGSQENNGSNVSNVDSLQQKQTEPWLLAQADEATQEEVDLELNLTNEESEPAEAELAQETEPGESSPEESSSEESNLAESEEPEVEGAIEENLPVSPESEANLEEEIEAIEEASPESEAEAEPAAETSAEEAESAEEAPVVESPVEGEAGTELQDAVETDIEADVEDSGTEQSPEGAAGTAPEDDQEVDTELEQETIDLEEEITPPAQILDDAAPPASPDTVPPDAESPETAPTPGEAAPPTGTTVSPESLEYLDPDPNPLSFPTDPSEVEIVGTQPITLAQAIELGIRNNEELQRTRLELQRSQAALREAEAANFPTVDVGADLTLQGSQQPDTQFNPLTGQQEADGTQLQTSLGLGGAVQANYAIFTSGRRSAIIQAAEREVRLQELSVESATEDLILQISQAYYDLQAADEQVQIFQAALDEADRSLRDAEALERAGVGTRFDVLQAQVDVANAQQDLRNQLSQQEISRRRLVERLNLSQSVTLAAAEPVEVAGVWELTLEETIVQAFRNRAELEQQLVQREIAERNRRASLAQLGPQVNLSAQYGVNNTLASDPDSIAEDFGFLSSFQVQLGVSLRLFDGGQARAQARQAEANIAIAESQFANVRDQIRLEVEEAYSQLDANFENIQTTALAVQQAEEALRLARLRFQAGVGTQTDVLRSQTELTRSRFNNLQAILNYNRALVALQRAVSNLPEGFLNEAP
ncbi:TolC family protein [Egbenema bharatensis]|uniref:TolC family protein n=1 Tax=Egbenema bharatensis TaxID=3463334 RepID=UPI003A8AF586